MTEQSPSGMPPGWPFDTQGGGAPATPPMGLAQGAGPAAPAGAARPRTRTAPEHRATPAAVDEPAGAADTADLAVPPDAIAAAEAARAEAARAEAARTQAGPAETVENTRPTPPPARGTARHTDQDAT